MTKTLRLLPTALLALALAASASAAPAAPDPQAWWALTRELSSDAMEGRLPIRAR